ncbi:EAL domain-containing protein [Pectobacterium parmentieri]|uniref:cyclic-guanylate-specific phosphodiesterase n=3 Tax=Pectobacterium parmentieri TaxID=1905730 RepID=A0A0H3I9M6_PECPM|nr:Putative EAL-containing signal transduction protein [Pectobacterium parmentieri]MBI0469919.1 EAL domain-containing protein [Pectobacterium parmentieri]MBI0492519.1 EAL domain-containing protein [Pectobacterium parmentieri]MBI0552965.1 EAL domain-containing protein [Pectobacterium parmentieri]MBI0569163.1 EAL domain-containing protein [Pectobacterium parmentieri]
MHFSGFKKITRTIFMMIFVSFSFLFLLNELLVSHQENKLMLRSEKLRFQAEMLAKQALSALNDINAIDDDMCSPNYIEKLRVIRWRHPNIEDVTSLKGNDIYCSSFWGEINPPLPITVKSETGNNKPELIGVKNNNKTLYNNIGLYQGHAAVFIARETYESILSTVVDGYFVMTSADKSHKYFESDPKGYTASGNSFLRKMFTANASLCSPQWQFCVIAQNAHSGLLLLTTGLLTFVMAAALMLGGFLTFFFFNIFDKRKSLKFRLKKSINKGDMFLEYQPMVNAIDGEIAGLEALVRWRDDIHGYVSPENFIKISEKIGFYSKISDFVIKTSMREMSVVLKKNKKLTLSINITDHEISDPEFISRLIRVCALYDVEPCQIKLEISERCQLAQKEIQLFAENVAKVNIGLAIDDFGVANSNLAWLTGFRFDEVKFDGSLMKNLDNENKEKILYAICSLIKDMGKDIVFEGVEDAEQLKIAREIDASCLIQGWFFYRSLPAKNIENLLINQEKMA